MIIMSKASANCDHKWVIDVQRQGHFCPRCGLFHGWEEVTFRPSPIPVVKRK